MNDREKVLKIFLVVVFLFGLSYVPALWGGGHLAQVISSNFFSSENRNEVVSKAQAKLKELGLYRGSESGLFGVRTKNAILDYQRKVGLRDTGILDKETQDSLFGASLEIEPDEDNPIKYCTLKDTVTVLPRGQMIYSASLPVGKYVLRAEGTYIYRSGGHRSDALFSRRIPSDPGYGNILLGYSETDTAWRLSGLSGQLGVRVNDMNPRDVWGTRYNSEHIYYHTLKLDDIGQISFQILDDVYSDNRESITVTIWGDCGTRRSGGLNLLQAI